MTFPVQIRPSRDSDLPYVVNAWRSSFEGYSALSKFDRDVYFRLMARHIGALVREPGAGLRIACDEEDDDAIVGFAAYTGPELHYVYVRGGEKTSMRKQGIARMLVETLEVKTYTFRTPPGERRIKPSARGWTYAPRTASWADGKIKVEIT